MLRATLLAAVLALGCSDGEGGTGQGGAGQGGGTSSGGDSCDGSGVWAMSLDADAPGCDLSGTFGLELSVTRADDGTHSVEVLVDSEGVLGTVTTELAADGTGCRMLLDSVQEVTTDEATGTNTLELDVVAATDGAIVGSGTLVQLVYDLETGEPQGGCEWTMTATGTRRP